MSVVSQRSFFERFTSFLWRCRKILVAGALLSLIGFIAHPFLLAIAIGLVFFGLLIELVYEFWPHKLDPERSISWGVGVNVDATSGDSGGDGGGGGGGGE
jgi:hypothetical protein